MKCDKCNRDVNAEFNMGTIALALDLPLSADISAILDRICALTGGPPPTDPSEDFEGRTETEAVYTACAKLGRHVEDLEYDVIDEGSGAIFGLGERPVRIRVRSAP